MTSRQVRRRAARKTRETASVSGLALSPEDLSEFKTTAAPFVQRWVELRGQTTAAEATVGAMIRMFLRAKGYPVNASLDYDTGRLTLPVTIVPDTSPAPASGMNAVDETLEGR